MKEEQTVLTDKERELIQRVADMRGISFDDAATALASEAIESRFRRRTGKGPANNVRQMRTKKRG